MKLANNVCQAAEKNTQNTLAHKNCCLKKPGQNPDGWKKVVKPCHQGKGLPQPHTQKHQNSSWPVEPKTWLAGWWEKMRSSSHDWETLSLAGS